MSLIARLPRCERFLSRVQPPQIDGAEVAGSSAMDLIDPSSGMVLGRIAAAGAVLGGPWGSLSPQDRGRLIWKLAYVIEGRKDVFGQLVELDNGKPITLARDVDAIRSARRFRCFVGRPDKIGVAGFTSAGRQTVQTSAANTLFADADPDQAIPGAVRKQRTILHLWGALLCALQHPRPGSGRAAPACRKVVGRAGNECEWSRSGPPIARAQIDKVPGNIMDWRGRRLAARRYGLVRAADDPVGLPGLPAARAGGELRPYPLLAALRRRGTRPRQRYPIRAGDALRNAGRVARLDAKQRAATVWVNCRGDTDAALSFGGMGQSGHGCDMARDALALFTRRKSVWQGI